MEFLIAAKHKRGFVLLTDSTATAMESGGMSVIPRESSDFIGAFLTDGGEKMQKLYLAPLLLLISLPVQAQTWIIDQEQSRVIFHYSYAGDPYEGEFRNVDAVFEIDPLSPGSCDFSVTIPIADIGLDSPEALDYLLDVELFDVDRFPTARFEAEECRLQSMDSFVSNGTLTIRDVTRPMSFPFTLSVEMNGGQIGFRLKSNVTIMRLEYGVGQGYWASTAEIPNDIGIEVDVYAFRQ